MDTLCRGTAETIAMAIFPLGLTGDTPCRTTGETIALTTFLATAVGLAAAYRAQGNSDSPSEKWNSRSQLYGHTR